MVQRQFVLTELFVSGSACNRYSRWEPTPLSPWTIHRPTVLPDCAVAPGETCSSARKNKRKLLVFKIVTRSKFLYINIFSSNCAEFACITRNCFCNCWRDPAAAADCNCKCYSLTFEQQILTLFATRSGAPSMFSFWSTAVIRWAWKSHRDGLIQWGNLIHSFWIDIYLKHFGHNGQQLFCRLWNLTISGGSRIFQLPKWVC